MSRARFYGALLVAYLVILGVVTLTPRPGAEAVVDFIPLHQTWQLVVQSGDRGEALTVTVGNIALFVPLGWLIPMTLPRVRSFRAILVATVACSAVIEVCQLLLVTGRSPTIDDVLFNAFGGAIGAVMFFAPRGA
jgi:glycopeptide antibiotics resistance protein